MIPGWRDFNDEKPLKGLRCVGGGDLNDEKPLKGLSSVPVIFNIGDED